MKERAALGPWLSYLVRLRAEELQQQDDLSKVVGIVIGHQKRLPENAFALISFSDSSVYISSKEACWPVVSCGGSAARKHKRAGSEPVRSRHRPGTGGRLDIAHG